jgi:hypothetical protein
MSWPPVPTIELRESRGRFRRRTDDGRDARSQSSTVMYARAVEDAAARLRELHREEWEDLTLAVLALALAVAATQVRPALALPLLFGGLVIGVFGMRALLRRWDLVERLAGERDAYVIADVLAFAEREATMERRRTFAALIRSRLSHTRPPFEARVLAARRELEALAAELDDDQFTLEPACAVACLRLLSDVETSPLLNPDLPSEELRSRARKIRSGFTPRRRAA